jgi:hypothetical protein
LCTCLAIKGISWKKDTTRSSRFLGEVHGAVCRCRLLELSLEVALSGRGVCACLKYSPSVYIGFKRSHVRIHQKYIVRGLQLHVVFSDEMLVVQHSLFQLFSVFCCFIFVSAGRESCTCPGSAQFFPVTNQSRGGYSCGSLPPIVGSM